LKEELNTLKVKHTELQEELNMEFIISKKKGEKLDNHNKEINKLTD